MKKRNLLSGMTLALLMTLGIAGVAHATNYDCNDQVNNPIPTSYNGDVNVTNAVGTNCAIGHDISATGTISISVHGTLSVAKLTAGGILNVNSEGLLTASDDFASTGSYTYVSSQTEVNVKKVSSAVDTTTISSPGKIQTQDVSAFGYLTIISTGDEIIVNGDVSGHYAKVQVVSDTKDITISGTASNVNSGQIFQAGKNITIGSIANQNGDVRVFGHQDGIGTTPLSIGPGGVGSIINDGGFGIYISGPTGISYNGNDILKTANSGGPQGYIYLDGGATGKVTLAGTISVDRTAGAGSIAIFSPEIIANDATLDASAAPGSQAGYINLITAKITNSGGLTINNNGDGGFAADIHLGITPVGSWGIAYPPTNIDIPVQTTSFQPSSNPLTISGAGTATGAALTVTANGDNRAIQIYGYPLAITSTTGNITQQGIADAIYVNSTDYVNNIDGALTLGGNIEIHGNTTSSAGDPNVFGIRGTSLAVLSGHVLLDASGITGGAGSDILLPFDSGSLPLGGTGNTVELNANGDGGKGGNITAGWGGTLAVSINSGTAATASALSGNRDGGTITITANSLTTATGGTLAANGSGTGLAGTVSVTEWDASQAVTLSGLTISTTGLGDGSTNNIQLHIAGDLTVDSSSVLDTSSTSTQGGQILVSFGENDYDKTLVLHGTLRANALSTQAGQITVTSPNGGIIGTDATFEAFSPGNGGIVALNTGNPDQPNTLSITGGSIDVSGLNAAQNGSIQLQAGGTTDTTSGLVSVSVTKILGQIQASGSTVNLTSSQTTAQGILSLKNVVALNGNVTVTATSAKTAVLKSNVASAAVSATGNVSLTGDGIDVALTTASGNDFIQAGGDSSGDITLATTSGSNGDITLGSDLKSDGTITIDAHGSGNVIRSGGKVVALTTGADNRLNITTVNGSIGGSTSGSPLVTGVKTLSAKVTTSNFGTIRIANNSGSVDDTLSVVSTKAGGELNIQSTGLISIVDASTAIGDITLIGNGVTIDDTGNGIVGGGQISIDTTLSSNADVTLIGNIQAADIVTLSAQGTGNIVSSGGKVGPKDIGYPSLVLKTVSGSVGGGTFTPLLTTVNALDITQGTGVGGSVNISNDDPVSTGLTIIGATVSQGVKIKSNGPLLILGNVEVGSSGDIEIFTTTGSLTDIGSNEISTPEGNIRIYTGDVSNFAVLTIGLGARVKTQNGDIYIFRGTRDPAKTAGAAPVFPLLLNGGIVYWGTTVGNPPKSITASGTNIVIGADHAVTVFESAGAPDNVVVGSNADIRSKRP